MINQKQSLIAIRLGFLRAMSSLYPLEDLAYSSHQHVVSPFIISASDNEEEDGLQKHRFGMLTWTNTVTGVDTSAEHQKGEGSIPDKSKSNPPRREYAR